MSYKNHKEYLIELGEKIKLYRISKGFTQQDIEDKSGVSKRSISRLELGESIQMDNFIKVLTALGLGENIDILVPDMTKRPSYYLESLAKKPQRVRKTNKNKVSFKWGDEK